MATAATAYNLSDALLGLGEDQLRRKGEQRGYVRRRGGKWHIRFSAWVAKPDGNLEYKEQEREVAPASGPEGVGKREAQRIGYDKFVMPANGPANCPQGLATLKQFIDTRFRPDHINGTLKKSGKSYYESLLKCHILPSLGGVKMSSIQPQMIQALISAKRDAGLSTQTLKHIRNVLSAIFDHARALKFWTGELPTEHIKLPKVVHKTRQALTAIQVKLLMQQLPAKYQPLVTVLAQTGLRIGEACGLRWKRVNLSDEYLVVDGEAIPPNSILISENFVRGEYTTLKTATSRRKIPLTATAWVALMMVREISEWIGEEHPVFAARNGEPIDGHNIAKRFLKPAAKTIGAPWVSWHCLRHTTATATDGFLTPAQKKSLLGHASSAMSDGYTHPEMEAVRVALEKAEDGGRVM